MTVTPHFLAECSAIAYDGEAEIAAWLKARGWKLERFISRNDTEVFVATSESEKAAVIAFRGTEPTHIVDIMSDVQASKRYWVHGKVHGGFFKALGWVKSELFDLCDELRQRDLKLFLTGHSLGAALATLLAAQRGLNGWPFPAIRLTTFGSPRVGNAAFARFVDTVVEHDRYVNNNDIVTRLPLPAKWLAKFVPFGWLLPAGYKHSGRLRYITATGDIIDNPSKWRLFVDRLKGRWFAGRHFLSDGSRDHSVQNYVELLA